MIADLSSEDCVLGIIYPLIPEHARRFLEDKKTVFVKFVSRGSTPRRLGPRSRLFFYVSGGTREIVGEAKIVSMAMADPPDIMAEYATQLFLTSDELDEYIGERRTKAMLVLVLTNVKKYHLAIAND